jgi:DNA-binding FadR family transcriptional regulator
MRMSFEMQFEPIRQVRAHEHVADQIRRHIALRLIPPGEALPADRELAAAFGVGRPTIQHALALLEADNLVEGRRGRYGGTFVSEPKGDEQATDNLIARVRREREELEECIAYRHAVEPAIARLTAETRRKPDIAAVLDALDGMTAAQSSSDYLRHDTEFHLAIARGSRNRFAVRQIEEILLRLNDPMTLLPESQTWHERTNAEHRLIVRAIEARDANAAETAMGVHVTNSGQGLRAVLASVDARPLSVP